RRKNAEVVAPSLVSVRRSSRLKARSSVMSPQTESSHTIKKHVNSITSQLIIWDKDRIQKALRELLLRWVQTRPSYAAISGQPEPHQSTMPRLKLPMLKHSSMSRIRLAKSNEVLPWSTASNCQMRFHEKIFNMADVIVSPMVGY
ncbi:hypothetical protein M8C21_003794, partial [Ambrosia artemisiifolia]